MPYLLTVRNRHGMVHQTQLVDAVDSVAMDLPGQFSLVIEDAQADDLAPRLIPHGYRAPLRVPERGHLELPCEVCGCAFGAAIHRRPPVI